MNLYYARDILHYHPRELWDLKDSKESFRLLFDDNEITTTWQQTLVSWYFWHPIRDYPETPLLMKFHVNNDFLSPGLEWKIENRISEAVIKAYPDENLENIEASLYRGVNLLHNAFATQGEEYIATVDVLAILEIYEHPDIQKAIKNVEPTQSGVTRCYTEINKVINNSPVLRSNEIARAAANGTLKLSQFQQVVGLRGFCSEADQGIFPTMVNASFATGINRASFFAIISRDATKANQATNDPVKQAEHYNRELQLFSYGVKSIEMGDCGSTETIPWVVKKKDLDFELDGKVMVNEDGTYHFIRPSDNHLVGKTVRLRHVAGCWHEKDGYRCSTCVGGIGRSVQRGVNLGHNATITQNKRVSQDVISTKHVLMSAVSEGFEIDQFYAGYLVNAGDESEVILSSEIWDKHVLVDIPLAYIPRLSDVVALQDFTPNDLIKISGIEDLTIIIMEDGKVSREITIPTSHGSYKPYLTADFIQHMKDYGFDNNGKRIRVDLMNWDSSSSIIKFPDRHTSTLEMMLELKSNLFMSSKEGKERLRYDLTDPDIMAMALRDICDMTNRKFSVNMAIVELVLYSLMVRDPENGDYRLPKKGTGRRFDTKTNIMAGRSLSVKAAYERQFTMITSPSSFTNRIRPNHPFDHILIDVDAESRKSYY